MNKLPVAFDVAVTDEDILLGAMASSQRCPIARATKRALALRALPMSYVSVQYSNAYIGDPGKYATAYVHDAFDFVMAFDGHTPVQPRTVHFQLMNVPAEEPAKELVAA